MHYLVICIIVIIIVLLIYGLFSNYFFSTTEYSIVSDKMNSLLGDKKIIILSDLHDCKYGKNNRKLIKKIDSISPKAILIAGDMLNHKSSNNNEYAKNLIRHLASKYVIYYADGNHEQGFFSDHKGGFDEDKFIRFFDIQSNNCNIHHLANSYFEYKKVRIYGLRIDRAYYKRIHRPEFSLDYLEKLLGKSEKNCYNIVIAHNPVYFEDYVRWGADLVISGHLHGGFIRLPYIGGLISPQLQLFPKYSGGLYRYNKGFMILSKGLGMHTIKVRIFNRPELIVASFSKKQNGVN